MTDVVKVRARIAGQIRIPDKRRPSGFRRYWKEKGEVFFVPADEVAYWMEPVAENDAPEPEPVVDPEDNTLAAAADPLARIRGALEKLDPDNDAHWTKAGDPAMDAIEAILGDKSVTRDDVKAADPGFNRDIAAARS